MHSQISPLASPHPLEDQRDALALSAGPSGWSRWIGWAGVGSARGFLIAWGATLGLGLMGMAGLCLYVNPWGNYGPSGFHTLGDARKAKTDYIDGLATEALPEAIILGSSNTMRYRPEKIREALGLRAFNYAVYWGKAEDHWCILSHLVNDLGHRPGLIVMGVDTWTFAPPADEHPIFPGVRRRLLNTPQLVRHLPDVNPVKVQWARFTDLFSGQQLRLSWRLLRGGTIGRTTRPTLLQSDRMTAGGTRLYYGDILGDRGNIFEATEAGQYPITDLLSDLIEQGSADQIGYLTRNYDFERFWPRRVQFMERLLELCREQDIKVVFAINPVHPVFYDLLAKRTPHLQNLERLRGLLRGFERDYDVVLGSFDASHIDNFSGDPDGFYDPMHPATGNCDLILDRVIRLLEAS